MHAAASPCKAAPSSGSALRAALRWATGSPRMMHRRVPPARVPAAIRDLLNPPAADTLGMGAYRRHTSCSDAARGWIKAARAVHGSTTAWFITDSHVAKNLRNNVGLLHLAEASERSTGPAGQVWGGIDSVCWICSTRQACCNDAGRRPYAVDS